MIAAQILYNIAVALLFGVAAVAGERLLRLVRRPARFVWIAAILGAVAFLCGGFARRPDAAPTALPTGVASIDFPDALDAHTSGRTSRPAERRGRRKYLRQALFGVLTKARQRQTMLRQRVGRNRGVPAAEFD